MILNSQSQAALDIVPVNPANGSLPFAQNLNEQECYCSEPHEQKDTQIKVEETNLQAEVKIPDKPKQVKVLLVQSPHVDRNQPEELAPKDMVEKALATVNTHMTSGGETADHFLTVRNLKAAMDGLRDS